MRRRKIASGAAQAEAEIQPPRPAVINAYWHAGAVVLVEPGGAQRRMKVELSCLLRTQDYTREVARELRGSRFVLGVAQDGEDWVRVRWVDREARRRGCLWLEQERKVQTYEGDVTPVQRYMADHDPLVAPPRRCYLDIETDSRLPFSRKEEMRVLCWCIVDGITGEPVTGVLEADTDAAERALLEALWRVLHDYDQVLAWNGDRFDFPVIAARTEKVGLRVNGRRWLWCDQLELFRRMNMMAAESGEEKRSFALQAVAMAVLGEGKDDFDSSKTWEAWSAGGDDRERMVRYCIKDTQLLHRIEGKTGYVELLGTLCEVCGCFPDTHGISPSVQVEAFLLRLARMRGIHFKTRHIEDEEQREKFRGAFVLDPKWSGITKEVHVADFSGLYPNIIVTWNMGAETLRERPQLPPPPPSYLRHSPAWQEWQKRCDEANKPPPGVAVAPTTGAWFAQEPQSILAEAVTQMKKLRSYWKKRAASLPANTPEWSEAHRRDTAYKIANNIFFGVVSSPMSRVFDRVVGESITQSGAWLIQETMRHMETAHRLDVGYGDTDSSMARGCGIEQFKVVVKDCNENLYPPLLAERGCARNEIVLDNDKTFERIVFVSAKRYVARILMSKGKEATDASEPEVKGLEYKRGDSTRLARKLQKEVVDLLCKQRCEDPAQFAELVVEWQRRVLEDSVDLEDVMVSKRLTKPLREYAVRKKNDGTDAASLPHVALARVLKERGRDVGEGTKIEYVCVDGASKPKGYALAEDWAGDCDRHELWEGAVYPPTMRLLEAAFPGGGWERWERTRPARPRGRRAPAPGALTLPGLDLGAPAPRRRASPAARTGQDELSAPAPAFPRDPPPGEF